MLDCWRVGAFLRFVHVPADEISAVTLVTACKSTSTTKVLLEGI